MKFLLAFLLLFSHQVAFAWGATGHRAVGLVAEKHLTAKTKKAVQELLGTEKLSISCNWADVVRSNPAYDSYVDWHYASVADGERYEKSEKKKTGDVVMGIHTMIARLKDKKLPANEKADALRYLGHFVGDLHQPLHIGRKDDRGGNDIKVVFFGSEMNLHEVWDTAMIDKQRYSYTELADLVDHKWGKEKEWLKASVEDWAFESVQYRARVYEFTDKFLSEKEVEALYGAAMKFEKTEVLPKVSWQYLSRNYPLMEQRIYQAGIRLAQVLNEIFDKK